MRLLRNRRGYEFASCCSWLLATLDKCHGEEDVVKQDEINEARWEAEAENLDRYSPWFHTFQPGRVGPCSTSSSPSLINLHRTRENL